MINVVIVDDHELICTLLKKLLEDVAGIKVLGMAKNGDDALQLVRQLKPQVVLMDIKMPGISGLETTRRLLRAVPDVKVIIITAYENDVFPSFFMRAGALGYLTKGTSKDEMMRAIRAVNAGQRYFSPDIAEKLALKKIGATGQSPFDALTERELQIVMMLTQGVKPKEIAKKLFLSPKTINSYRYRIFEKLGIKSDVDLTHLALRYGILDYFVSSMH